MTIVRRYVSLMLAVQLLAGCGQQAPAPDRAGQQSAPVPGPSELAADERLVVAFGDSLYAGYGLPQDQSFPSVLERKVEALGTPVRVVNAGVSGDTSAAGLARLDFTLAGLSRSPDLAIVGLGANDALRGIDPAQTRDNLDKILAELGRRNIPVVLTGMMAPRNLGRDYVQRFDTIFPDLARKHGATLDPFFMAGVIDRPDRLLSDGLHPNASGVEHMAGRIAPMVDARLGKGAVPTGG